MLPHPITVSEPSLDSISLHLTAFSALQLVPLGSLLCFLWKGNQIYKKNLVTFLPNNWKAQIQDFNLFFLCFPEFVYRIDLPKCFNPHPLLYLYEALLMFVQLSFFTS